ncbi:hypothetical protein ACQPW3_23925 [Actinosynnema sp. CA-248983]
MTRELYEGLQRAEFDRWDAIIAEDVLINSPARFGQTGLGPLKEWAKWFVRLGKRIDLIDEHLALDPEGNGRGFIIFNLHWKHDEPFFDVTPTGREGTSVETILLAIENRRITRIDVAGNTVDLVVYLWQRNWPYPHNVCPEPLVTGIDRRP